MKFDRLMLLADGHMVYNGPTKDVVAYFANLGYKCPKYTNPAEFISTPSPHCSLPLTHPLRASM
jgi:ABC-type multidrug transport system ATPase subunit